MCGEGMEEWGCRQIMEAFEIERKDILKAQEKMWRSVGPELLEDRCQFFGCPQD